MSSAGQKAEGEDAARLISFRVYGRSQVFWYKKLSYSPVAGGEWEGLARDFHSENWKKEEDLKIMHSKRTDGKELTEGSRKADQVPSKRWEKGLGDVMWACDVQGVFWTLLPYRKSVVPISKALCPSERLRQAAIRG